MIANTFIRRPVTAIVISVVLVLVGLISMNSLPIAQYPDISPPVVTISGNFIGADAQTVEQTTTTAIETQVNGVPGMSYLSSNSSSSGQSGINVTFDVGTNVDIAALDVQNRVSVAQPTLPDVVKRLGLVVRKRNPSIMMVLAIYSPNGSHDGTFLGNYANIYIKDALQRVKGVGDITSLGDDFGARSIRGPAKWKKADIFFGVPPHNRDKLRANWVFDNFLKTAQNGLFVLRIPVKEGYHRNRAVMVGPQRHADHFQVISCAAIKGDASNRLQNGTFGDGRRDGWRQPERGLRGDPAQ